MHMCIDRVPINVLLIFENVYRKQESGFIDQLPWRRTSRYIEHRVTIGDQWDKLWVDQCFNTQIGNRPLPFTWISMNVIIYQCPDPIAEILLLMCGGRQYDPLKSILNQGRGFWDTQYSAKTARCAEMPEVGDLGRSIHASGDPPHGP